MPGNTEPAPRWEPDQLGAFIDQVRNDRFFALWMLAATTGVPFDRIVTLERDDIDLEEGRFSPAAIASGRGGPRRGPTYRLEPDTYDAVRGHVANWERERQLLAQGAPRLFVWSNGVPLDSGSAMRMFEQRCRNAGVPVVTINDMRLAYVLAALESGIPTRIFRDRLGRGTQMTPAASEVRGQDQTHSRRESVSVGQSGRRAQETRQVPRSGPRAARGRRL